MEEDGDGDQKNVCTKLLPGNSIQEVEDRLSQLPDCLIYQILLNFSTKDVVKTSVLSKRWRNIWRYVPVLDLDYDDFGACNNTFVSFVDKFLGFNRESCLQKFKSKFDYSNYLDNDCITRWINIVTKRKVQHLHVLNRHSLDRTWMNYDVPIMSPSVYTCESLVSLKLCMVILPVPEFVSLPFLKVIDLEAVYFAKDLAFEMLISGCPVLETLTLWRRPRHDVHALRVCSKSLLSFTLSRPSFVLDHMEYDDRVVAIDAPRLEYLDIGDNNISNFIIKNTDSLVRLQGDLPVSSLSTKMIDPNDSLLMRNMIGKFLNGISSVKVMNIFWNSHEVIYNYSKYEQLPLFRNLSFLSINFEGTDWKVLPILLESCPNLKSLTMILWGYVDGIPVVPGPPRLLTSLEYVKIEGLMEYDEETRMRLARYFLENSTVLKKFTFHIWANRKEKEELAFLKKLLSIPRLSTSCEVVVLSYSSHHSSTRAKVTRR